MGFYRIFPSSDTWITDKAIDSNANRMTGSNHGRDPGLSIFSIKGEFSSGSVQLSRILLNFSLTELSGKMFSEKTIPSSSISYYLKMYDMVHDDTIPTSYDLFIYPLSRSWDEGNGLDEANFLDAGYANWSMATSTAQWINSGSDFYTASFGSGSQHFDNGSENLEVNVTQIVNAWLTGNLGNNGLIVKLGNIEETNGTDYFIKMFHGRESKYIDRLPYIEARWSNILKDNRKNFAYGQNNNLYLYNFVRGELTSLAEPITVQIKDTLLSGVVRFSQSYSATMVENGIYSIAPLIYNTSSFSGTLYDIWSSGSVVYMTGTFVPLILTGSSVDQYDEFIVNVNNLRQIYDSREEARIKVNVRKRDYKTHLGVLKSASLDMEKQYIEKMYYSIINDETGEEIIPFGTGSIAYTQLSYDENGNYFNLFLNSFVPGFMYRIKFLIDINKYDKKIIDNAYRFKVI